MCWHLHQGCSDGQNQLVPLKDIPEAARRQKLVHSGKKKVAIESVQSKTQNLILIHFQFNYIIMSQIKASLLYGPTIHVNKIAQLKPTLTHSQLLCVDDIIKYAGGHAMEEVFS